MDKPTVRTVGICVGHSLKTRPMNYYSVAEVDAYITHLEAKRSEAEHRLQLARLQRDKLAALVPAPMTWQDSNSAAEIAGFNLCVETVLATIKGAENV